MARSVYNDPDYVAKLPKTTFPLTQAIDFSSIPGALVPVFCDFLHPGEKISGYADMITRTNELQTAAFTKIDEYIEYFFVPSDRLNMIFGEWFFNIDDRSSVLRPATLPEQSLVLPNISAKSLYDTMMSGYTPGGTTGWEDDYIGQAIRLMSHFRFDVYHIWDYASSDTYRNRLWNIPTTPFQAYQAIYFDYYRLSQWENNDVEAYNTDDWMTTLDGDHWTKARLQKIFKLRLRNQNADYFTSCKPSPLQNNTGMLNINGVREAALLNINQWLDGTGFNFSYGKSALGTSTNSNTNVSIDLMGDAEVEQTIEGTGGRIGELYSRNVMPDGSANHATSFRRVDGQDLGDTSGNLTWNRGLDDDAVGFLKVQDENVNYDIYPSNLKLPSSNVNSIDGNVAGFTIDSNINEVLASLKKSITTSSIRTMFALEKLAKITGRAGKHYDDQVLAHYGYKIPKGVSKETYMLGQQHSQIAIGEVVSNVTVPDGSTAGEIFGKGFGKMEGKAAFNFTAPCHGIFMAIYSAVPQRCYTPSGSPKEYSQMSREDFPIPDLLNLGQQPLFWNEFDVYYNHDSYPIAAWQWQYMEEKSRVPMAIGAFSRYSYSSQSENGILSDWTVQYPVLNIDAWSSGYSSTMGTYNFKVLPSSFNSIMLMQWQSNSHISNNHLKVARLFDRDPLFHHLNMHVYKTSFMTTYGEPRID